jgi:hypothetical protein
MRSYEIYDVSINPAGVLPDGHIWRRDLTAVEIVEEHFALVPAQATHPSGVEGMYIDGFQVDHIPTGRRVFRGGLAGGEATRSQCVAFVESLRTMPVDWSSDDADLVMLGAGAKGAAFARAARDAALANNAPRPLLWGDFLAEGAGA